MSAIPGALEMVTLPCTLPGDAADLRVTADGPARVDAVLTQPLIERVVLGDGGRHGRALLRSFAPDRRTVTVEVPGDGAATVSAYGSSGHLVRRTGTEGHHVSALVVPGGFTVIER